MDVEILNVTVAEAAKMLRTNYGVVLNMCERGEIPAYREGRNWKIPISTLRQYVEIRAKKEQQSRMEELGDEKCS